jgi:hypothetical protein
MPSFYVDDIDIDVDEFLSACSDRERDELIKALVEDGHIEPDQLTRNGSYGVRNPNINDEKFWGNLEHLKKCRDLLSLEEETYINNLAERYKHLRC